MSREFKSKFPNIRKYILNNYSKLGDIIIIPSKDIPDMIKHVPKKCKMVEYEDKIFIESPIDKKTYRGKYITEIKDKDFGLKKIYALSESDFKNAFVKELKGGDSTGKINLNSVYKIMEDDDKKYTIDDPNFDSQFYFYRLNCDCDKKDKLNKIVDEMRTISNSYSEDDLLSERIKAKKISKSIKKDNKKYLNSVRTLNMIGGDSLEEGIKQLENYYENIQDMNKVDADTFEMRDFLWGVYLIDPENFTLIIKSCGNPSSYVMDLNKIIEKSKYIIDNDQNVKEQKEKTANIIKKEDGKINFRIANRYDDQEDFEIDDSNLPKKINGGFSDELEIDHSYSNDDTSNISSYTDENSFSVSFSSSDDENNDTLNKESKKTKKMQLEREIVRW